MTKFIINLFFALLFVVCNCFSNFLIGQTCPSSPSGNNGQGQSGCHPNDSPPTYVNNQNQTVSWTTSGAWTFSTGPANNLTIVNVYKGTDLYQSGNTLQSINGVTGNVWFGGYNQTSKKMCFYSITANQNTPANGNWVITFAASGTNSECTFNVNGSSITLPLIWDEVIAEKQNGQSVLRWSTASEQNTRDFVVQHSLNATDWSSLSTIPAGGNSTTTRNYSYVHQNPLKGNNYNYYRILQRDIDDKFSYSKIVSIIFNEPGSDVQVYPNPVHDQLTVFLAESQWVRLVNAAGATVWKGQLPAGRNTIPVQGYSKGAYVLTAGTQSFRVLIQ